MVDEVCPARVVISHDDLISHPEALNDWIWKHASGEDRVACQLDSVLRDRLAELGIAFETEDAESGAGRELKEEVEAIERWYLNDWMALDPKIRTSIVEGISVFLSLFDQPQVASVFCPPPPASDESPPIHIGNHAPDEDAEAVRPIPGLRRAAQERLDAGAPASSRRGRPPARTLPPAGRVHLRRYQSDKLYVITLYLITSYDVASSLSITPAITPCATGSRIPWSSPVRKRSAKP